MAHSSSTGAQSVSVSAERLKLASQLTVSCIADKREFLQISRAVGIGFIVMGTIGYIVKIIHIPINNILVYVFSTPRPPMQLVYFVRWMITPHSGAA
jgi:protein transport protein SEC61 subunit gamma-like protein